MTDASQRKAKVKKWLGNKYNLAFVALLIFSIIIRIYLFNITQGQAMWWDEAEYMATAKHWAFNVPYDLNPQRPPLFQLLAAFILQIGLSEATAQFLLVVIPSTLIVAVVYMLGKNMFSEKVALGAAAGTAVVWTYLFWTARFQPDFLSVLFQLLAIYAFWMLFKSPQPSMRYAIFGGIFAALGFYFKISALLVPVALAVFALWKDGWKAFTNKHYWIAVAAFAIALIPFVIWQYALFGNPLAFAPSYIEGRGVDERALGWQSFTYFYLFPHVLFFLLFLAGLAIEGWRVVLSADRIIKEKQNRLDASIFCALILAATAAFYLFYIQGVIEDRWVFLFVPFIFYFAARAVEAITSKLAGIQKHLPAICTILLFAILFYVQISHAVTLAELKAPSYGPVREASLWIKQNSQPTDRVLSISYTQTVAYSERQVYSYSSWNATYLNSFIEEHHPKYLMVSVFEPHPQWVSQWLTDNQARLNPVMAYPLAQGQTQAALILYEIR